MGTWTSIERAESRVWSFSDRWSEQTLERVWVTGWEQNANPTNDPFPGDAALYANLPARPQQRLEAAVHSPNNVPDSWLKQLICRTVTVEPARERPHTWIVRARYTTEKFPWSKVDDWGAEYMKQTRVIGSRTVAMYRQSSGSGFFPSNGDVTFPPTSDLGGTKVDINGNPRRYQVAQQQVVVENIRDRTKTDSQTTTADDPDWATILTTFINKRNSTSFLGWATGSVLCTGITATLDSEAWRISATFLFDDWYHLEQVPVSYPNGMPILAIGATVAGEAQQQCNKVVWFQPYPDKAEFANLYGSVSTPGPISTQFTKAGPNRIT
jgi:hypothetical protein